MHASVDTASRQPRKWTPAEDQKLREEVEAQLVDGDVKDWCRIADQLPGRTNKDCRKRWHNSVAGGLKKGQWSKSEDELLSRGVEQFGQRWTLVSNCVISRSADQCAKRWQQSLDPDLDRSEWRDLEDHLLIDATQRLGRHWKDIQREHFPGRSKNDIKNRYTVLVRRYQNQGITLPSATSSPSESSTPAQLSSYAEEDDFLSPTHDTYGGFLAAPPQATSSRSRQSWSSVDNDTYATWSTSQDYNIPMAMPGPGIHHTTTAVSQYGPMHARPLASNIPSASAPLDWTNRSMQQPPMQSRSPEANTYMIDPSFYNYSHYPIAQQPMMAYDSAYTAPAGQAPYTSMPSRPHRRSPTSQEGGTYGSDASTTYNPRNARNHPYGY